MGSKYDNRVDETEDDILKRYLRGSNAAAEQSAPAINAAPATVDNLHEYKLVQQYLRKPDAVAAPEAKGDAWWQGAKEDTWTDFGKRVGIGVIRGGKDVLDTLAEGVAAGADYGAAGLEKTGLISRETAKGVTDSRNALIRDNQSGREAFNAEYNPFMSASAGRMIGQVAGTAMPVGQAMRGAEAIGSGVRAAAPVLNRVMGNVTAGRAMTGAAAGGTFAGLTPNDTGASTAENIGYGAIGGAIMNPIVTPAANMLIGGVSQGAAKLANTAKEKFGIPMSGGQLSDSPAMKFFQSTIDRMPLSGAGKFRDKQQVAFNREVSKTFGENAERVTPEVMAAAKSRLGDKFNEIAKKSSVNFDETLKSDLMNTLSEAKITLPQSEFNPIFNQVKNLVDKAGQGNGVISGETYQALTRKGAPLDRAMQSKDPNVSYYAGLVRESLDNALERTVPASLKAELQATRYQYKNMKTIEDMAEKAPTGDLSPALLMGAVRNKTGNMAYGGGGDIADLARIGQRFLKEPPSSGTAERLMSMGLLSGSGGGIAAGQEYYRNGDTASAAQIGALGAVGGMIAGRAVGGVLRNGYYTNALIKNGLGMGGAPIGRASLNSAAADLAPLAFDVKPKNQNKLLPAR